MHNNYIRYLDIKFLKKKMIKYDKSRLRPRGRPATGTVNSQWRFIPRTMSDRCDIVVAVTTYARSNLHLTDLPITQ